MRHGHSKKRGGNQDATKDALVPKEVFTSIYGEIVEDEEYAAIRVRIKSLEDGTKECKLDLHQSRCHGKG